MPSKFSKTIDSRSRGDGRFDARRPAADTGEATVAPCPAALGVTAPRLVSAEFEARSRP